MLHMKVSCYTINVCYVLLCILHADMTNSKFFSDKKSFDKSLRLSCPYKLLKTMPLITPIATPKTTPLFMPTTVYSITGIKLPHESGCLFENQFEFTGF